MRIAVQSLLLAPVLLAAAALAAQPAVAESHVNIPFNFVAAGKTCPAGNYAVKQGNLGTTLKLEGSSHSFTWVAGPGAPSSKNNRVILTFDQVGPTHMLRSVQYGAMITNQLDQKLQETIPAPEQAVAGQ